MNIRNHSLYTLILLIMYTFVARLVEAAQHTVSPTIKPTLRPTAQPTAATPNRPNIIYYIADDLGTGDVNQNGNGFTIPGFKANHVIATPNLETLASMGMRFQNLWGASVCGPARESLLTARTVDTGPVRGNGPVVEGNYVTLPNMTLPLAFYKLGYATGCVGKYGMGDSGTKSSAWNMGFRNLFFGYGTHVEAHYPFTTWMWNGTEQILFPINTKASSTRCLLNQCVFATDLFREKALGFIHQYANKQPFFLYWATISSHVGMWNVNLNEDTYPVTTYIPYAKTNWPTDRKGYASEVTNMDNDIGALLNTLDDLNIAGEQTMIIFSGDNNAELQYTNGKPSLPTFFQSTGGDNGHKRTMYNGGIRIPSIAVWPGHIVAGTNSFYTFALADMGKTILTLIGAPKNILDQFPDSNGTRAGGTVSVAPLWLNGDAAAYEQIPRDWLSSEYCPINTEASCLFAFTNIRNGLKLLIENPNGPYQLYNLSADPGERNNLATDPQYAGTITAMRSLRNRSRIPLPN